uniref:SD16627p n=1 Tax=Drosophila melanogaster TaxID=7227 RepID=Q8MRX1_DROME|nr:SD16627p [Drosophila melanogaster]
MAVGHSASCDSLAQWNSDAPPDDVDRRQLHQRYSMAMLMNVLDHRMRRPEAWISPSLQPCSWWPGDRAAPRDVSPSCRRRTWVIRMWAPRSSGDCWPHWPTCPC